MKLNPSFVLRKMLDDYIVVPTGEELVNFDAMITLNETAGFLWEHLQKGATVEQLTDALCSEYDVHPDEAERDVQDFVAELQKIKVLE